MNFASRLKELRKKNNLTQRELALKINKTRSTIAGYETERKQPDYETLKELATFFKVSIDYLIGYIQESKSTYSATNQLSNIPPEYIETFRKLNIDQIRFIKKMVDEDIDVNELVEVIKSLEKYFNKDN